MSRNAFVSLALASSILFAGCATTSDTTKGGLIGGGAGAALGAVAGAIIGNQQADQAKGRAQGALIGGLVGGAVGAGVGMGIGKYMDNQKAELKAAQIAVQKQQDNTLLVTLAGNSLNFATGSSVINEGSKPSLNSLASILVKYSEDKVLIEGHTDNVGNSTSNQVLSQQRADAIKNYLLVQGVPAANILASSGYGDSQPVVSNATATGRAQNRRVVLKISAPGLQE